MTADPNDSTSYDDCGFDISHSNADLGFDILASNGGRKYCFVKLTVKSLKLPQGKAETDGGSEAVWIDLVTEQH